MSVKERFESLDELFYEVEPFLCYNKIPPKSISVKFRKWFIKHRSKFTNEWDVYSIVKLYFSKNKNYIPKKIPRLIVINCKQFKTNKMKKKIKAIFIGKAGSLGYKKNTEYKLIISTDKATENIMIKNMNNADMCCGYASITAFLNNWDNIRHI